MAIAMTIVETTFDLMRLLLHAFTSRQSGSRGRTIASFGAIGQLHDPESGVHPVLLDHTQRMGDRIMLVAIPDVRPGQHVSGKNSRGLGRGPEKTARRRKGGFY